MGLSISLSDFISEPFEGSPYDRIYSIGSLEHVRPAELTSLYQKTYDALAPGGLAVHQFFSYRSDPYPISVAVLELFSPVACCQCIASISRLLRLRIKDQP